MNLPLQLNLELPNITGFVCFLGRATNVLTHYKHQMFAALQKQQWQQATFNYFNFLHSLRL